MSLFNIFENLWSRLPAVIKAKGNRLEVIRKWIAMYFNSKRAK